MHIIQGSRINGSFTLIFVKSSRFDQNRFRFKTKTLGLKIIINMLLMQINTRLLVFHVWGRILCKEMDQTWSECRGANNVLSNNTKKMPRKPKKFPVKASSVKPRKYHFCLLKCCYPFFGSHTKNEKIQKIYKKKYSKEIQNIIGARKGCWNAHKMARNWLRRFKNTWIEI